MVFVGAEFCPYCALERWALVVALFRFGTFSNLGQTISSSSTDVYPGLQSWSFKDSTFTSSSLRVRPGRGVFVYAELLWHWVRTSSEPHGTPIALTVLTATGATRSSTSGVSTWPWERGEPGGAAEPHVGSDRLANR